MEIVNGYKQIVVRFVFAVKHDLRYKARLVASGHLSSTPTKRLDSGVVS
jgi:hypothetical protein